MSSKKCKKEKKRYTTPAIKSLSEKELLKDTMVSFATCSAGGVVGEVSCAEGAGG